MIIIKSYIVTNAAASQAGGSGIVSSIVAGDGIDVNSSDPLNPIVSTFFVTPEQFGAVGDGVTNDQAAIQLAVDSGETVYFASEKTYLVNSTITLATGARLIGGAILKTTSNISIITIAGRDTSIDGLRLLGNDTGVSQIGINITGNAGLTLDYCNNHITNVTAKDLTIGFYVTLVLGTSGSVHEGAALFTACKAISCATGFYLDNRAEYCTLSNCQAFACTTGYRHNGGNNRWMGGQISDCTTGVTLGTGSNDGKGNVTGASINHCTTSITSTGLTQGFLFSDCYIQVALISIGTSTGIIFDGCVFGTADITVTNCTFTQIQNCYFRTTPTITITGTNPTWWNNRFQLGTIPSAVRDFYNWTTSKHYISGRFYSNNIVSGALTTQALGANILRAFPWRILETITIDLFEINVTTGVAGTCRFGIYSDDGTGYPGSLVTNSDAGTYDVTSSATFVQNTPAANITLTPGLYWIAFNANAAATLRAHGLLENIIGSAAGVAGDGVAWTVSLTYAAMPATFTAGGTVVTGQSINGCPQLRCRAV